MIEVEIPQGFLHDFKLEPYITKLNFKNRQELSRLRLSDHKLKVESGQYTDPKPPLEDRTCTFCLNSVGEYHFLITCPMYKEERQKLKRNLESSQTPKRQTIYDKKLFDLLSSCNENHIAKISNFHNSITKTGEEKLNLVQILVIPFCLFSL